MGEQFNITKNSVAGSKPKNSTVEWYKLNETWSNGTKSIVDQCDQIVMTIEEDEVVVPFKWCVR